MDTRRFRNDSHTQRLAQVRWLGWVMLMMFVLVQTATGAAGTGDRSKDFTVQSNASPQASAHFDPKTHEVTVTANPPAVAWDLTPALGRRSFVVYENNVSQPVRAVELAHAPLSIGVLLEHGGRFHALNEAVAENAARAIQYLKEAINPDDHVSMWTYGDRVRALAEPSSSASGLQRTDLNLGVAPSSESNFFDALLATLPQVEQMPGRRALIVISTGIDTFSDVDYSAAQRAARESGVPICAIDIGPLARSSLSVASADGQPYSRLKWQQAAARLAELARTSGCRAWAPASSFEFPAVFDGLLPNLRLQYVIHYRSTALDLPGTREVKIAWAAGNSKHKGTLQNPTAQGRVFAQAHYELTPPAVWASAGRMTWPFLNLSDTSVQIALRVPVTPALPSDGLLAATTTGGPGTQQP